MFYLSFLHVESFVKNTDFTAYTNGTRSCFFHISLKVSILQGGGGGVGDHLGVIALTCLIDRRFFNKKSQLLCANVAMTMDTPASIFSQ